MSNTSPFEFDDFGDYPEDNASPFDFSNEVNPKGAFLANEGFSAKDVARAEKMSRELGLSQRTVMTDIPAFEREATVRRVMEDPLLAKWTTSVYGNGGLVRDETDGFLHTGTTIDQIIHEGVPPKPELGFFEQFAERYEVSNMQYDLADVARRFAASKDLVEQEELRAEIISRQNLINEKRQALGTDIADYFHPSVIAEWVPQFMNTLSHMPKNLNIAVPVGASIGAIAGSAAAGVGAVPGAIGGAASGVGAAFAMSNFENTSQLERDLFIAQMATELDKDGQRIPTEEIATYGTVYGLGAAAVETLGVGTVAKLLGITDFIKGVGEDVAKRQVRSYLQQAIKDKTLQPAILGFGQRVLGSMGVEGTEEASQQFLSNLAELLLKNSVSDTMDFDAVSLSDGVVESFAGGAGLGLWLGGSFSAVRLAHDVRNVQRQQKFKQGHDAIHRALETISVKAETPQAMEEFLLERGKEMPGMVGDVYLPAGAVLELAQSGVDLVTPLELDQVQLSEAADLGQYVPVNMARAHARLDQASFEQFTSIMQQDLDSLNAFDVGAFDERAQEDMQRIEENYLEYAEIQNALDYEMDVYKQNLRANIQFLPNLRREATAHGGIDAYIDTMANVQIRMAQRLAERTGGQVTAVDVLRNFSFSDDIINQAYNEASQDNADIGNYERQRDIMGYVYGKIERDSIKSMYGQAGVENIEAIYGKSMWASNRRKGLTQKTLEKKIEAGEMTVEEAKQILNRGSERNAVSFDGVAQELSDLRLLDAEGDLNPQDALYEYLTKGGNFYTRENRGRRRQLDKLMQGGKSKRQGLSQQVLQAISSADTSLRQVASALKKIPFESGTVNIDIGGGKYDEGTNYLAEQGVENLVFDPFNRDEAHNRQVFERLKAQPGDTVTATNVLNVIAEPEVRQEVVRQAAKALKADGVAYFQIYEGDGKGEGRATSKGYQNNAKTAFYLDDVKTWFQDVKKRGNIIEARNPKQDDGQAMWLMEGFDGAREFYQGEKPLAPNGKPSNLSPELWETVRTPENRGTFSAESDNIYYQTDQASTRGKIRRLDDDSYVVSLFDKADLSTVTHETAHYFFLEMESLVQRGLADESLQADMQTLRDWVNEGREVPLVPGEALDVDAHEKLARGFELYLRDGKAPIPSLRNIFARFARWLKAVYKHAMQLNVDFDDEVKGVFDRMLAAEWEIELAAEKNGMQKFTKQELDLLDLPEDERKFFESLNGEIKREAEDKLLRARNRARAQLKSQITKDVEDEVNNMPVYLARDEMSKDGIDASEIDAIMGGEFHNAFVKRFNKASKVEGGKSPYELAVKYGYEDTEDFLADVFNAESKTSLKTQLIEERLAGEDAKYLADDFLYASQAFAKQQTKVAIALNKKIKQTAKLAVKLGMEDNTVISEKAVNARAQERIIKMSMREASNSYSFIVAARGAYRKEREALLKGDYAEALKWNTAARTNIAMVQQSKKINDDMGKVLRSAKAFVSVKEGSKTQKNPVARYYVNYLSSLYGMQNFDKQLAGDKTPKDVAKWAADVGLVLDATLMNKEYMLQSERSLQKRLNSLSKKRQVELYKELKVKQFNELANEIKTVIALERDQRSIQTAEGKIELEKAVEELTANIYKHNKEKDINQLSDDDETFEGVEKFFVSLLKMDTMTRELDGDEFAGIAWSLLYDPANDGTHEANVRLAKLKNDLAELFAIYTKEELSEIRGKKILSPSINGNKTLTKEKLLAIALNVGNEGNFTRLKNGYKVDGQALTDEQVWTALDVLTQKDWDFVQSIWDYFETYRKEMFDLAEKQTGVRPTKIEATPVQTKFGTYAGGYYPAVYNAKKTGLVNNVNPEEQKNIFAVPSVSLGSSKERKGEGVVGAPLKLSLDVIPEAMVKTIHYLSFSERIKNIYKIMRRPEVEEAIRSTKGVQFYKAMQDWLVDMAGADRHRFEGPEGILGWARSSQSIMSMGLSIPTALMQSAGSIHAVPEMGVKAVLQGQATVLANVNRLPEFMAETKARSQIMAFRIDSMDREVADLTRKVLASGKPLDWIRDNAFKPMGYVQFVTTDLGVWWGAYQKGLKDFNGDEKKSVKYADNMVEITQASGEKKNLARIQRGGELSKLVTMYYTFFGAAYQMMYRRVRGVERKGLVVGGLELANYVLIGLVLQNIITELIAMRGPEEDEELEEWLLRINIALPFQTVPYARDAVNALATKYSYKITPASTGMETILRASNNLFDVVTGEEDFDKETGFLLAKAGAYGLSLPAGRPLNSAQEFWDYLDGTDPEFDAWRILMGKKNDK